MFDKQNRGSRSTDPLTGDRRGIRPLEMFIVVSKVFYFICIALHCVAQPIIIMLIV